jgi:hypothetical protein
MLKVPKLAETLKKIGGEGREFEHIFDLTSDWVNGKTIQEIAHAYFGGDDDQTHTTPTGIPNLRLRAPLCCEIRINQARSKALG